MVEPTWVSYRQQVELSEGIPVSVPLSEEEEYSLSYQRLKDYVTPRSKMVVICNPNNPTGRVYTRGELEGMARWQRIMICWCCAMRPTNIFSTMDIRT